MPKLIPIGSRCLVTDLDPEVSLVKRAEAAGLHLVIGEENVPKPTSGKVEAVGSDPLIQELISVGDIVLFARHAGLEVQIEGKAYRSLELREIAHVIKPDLPTSPRQDESSSTGQPSPERNLEPPS